MQTYLKQRDMIMFVFVFSHDLYHVIYCDLCVMRMPTLSPSIKRNMRFLCAVVDRNDGLEDI
jgi:hypothetical protein